MCHTILVVVVRCCFSRRISHLESEISIRLSFCFEITIWNGFYWHVKSRLFKTYPCGWILFNASTANWQIWAFLTSLVLNCIPALNRKRIALTNIWVSNSDGFTPEMIVSMAVAMTNHIHGWVDFVLWSKSKANSCHCRACSRNQLSHLLCWRASQVWTLGLNHARRWLGTP